MDIKGDRVATTTTLGNLIRNETLKDELIPIHRLPALIPSSRRGKTLAMPTIYRWIESGKLKTLKIAGGRYVTAGDLEAFLGGDEGMVAPSMTGDATAGADAAGKELDLVFAHNKGGAVQPAK